MRTEREVGEALERLHLDHERPLHETCHRWRAALPSCGAPRSWDDGLDGAALCHDLFGVCASEAHGEACVRFRCGTPQRGGRDARAAVCGPRLLPSVVAGCREYDVHTHTRIHAYHLCLVSI